MRWTNGCLLIIIQLIIGYLDRGQGNPSGKSRFPTIIRPFSFLLSTSVAAEEPSSPKVDDIGVKAPTKADQSAHKANTISLSTPASRSLAVLPAVESTQNFVDSYVNALGVQQTYIAIQFNQAIVIANIKQGSLASLIASKVKKEDEDEEEKTEAAEAVKTGNLPNDPNSTFLANQSHSKPHRSNICIDYSLKSTYTSPSMKVYSIGFPIECHRWMERIHSLSQEHYEEHHETLPSALLALYLADIQHKRTLACSLTANKEMEGKGPKPRPFAVNCLIVDMPRSAKPGDHRGTSALSSHTSSHPQMYFVDVSGNFYLCNAIGMGFQKQRINRWLESRGRFLAQQRLQAKAQHHNTISHQDVEDAIDILHHCIVELYSSKLEFYYPNASSQGNNSFSPMEIEISCFQYPRVQQHTNGKFLEETPTWTRIEDVEIDLQALLAQETEIIEPVKAVEEARSEAVETSQEELTSQSNGVDSSAESIRSKPTSQASKHYRPGRLWQLVQQRASSISAK